MLNHLLLSTILTALFYFYNQQSGNFVNTYQYGLAFTGFALAIALFYRYFMPKGTAMPSVTQFLGLEAPSNGPNGDIEAPCYSVPYKIIDTQYGDKAVLAGYNENLGTYETGAKGLYKNPHEEMSKQSCDSIDYNLEKIPVN